MELNYFDLGHARRTHTFIINESGGSIGERDIGILSSLLEHVQNDLFYPYFEIKLTHLIYLINKGHAFTDGNKRTSIALGAYFLEINGMDFCVSRFIIEMENISVHVANNRIDKDLLQAIITSIINEPDYSEELQLRIVDAISMDEPGNSKENEF